MSFSSNIPSHKEHFKIVEYVTAIAVISKIKTKKGFEIFNFVCNDYRIYESIIF